MPTPLIPQSHFWVARAYTTKSFAIYLTKKLERGHSGLVWWLNDNIALSFHPFQWFASKC
jgi:hypothetical protein